VAIASLRRYYPDQVLWVEVTETLLSARTLGSPSSLCIDYCTLSIASSQIRIKLIIRLSLAITFEELLISRRVSPGVSKS
jgi:hypothetical protein